ncbi:GNAT family N-acetyltransferase [Pseudoclavibacter chungangensis]|uniref:GNAT family N-acetyltransferase n=1 Tax=Pseudoclavibacter chungangensis TaxID=587635 RepID=A0A7J5BNQ4_9MICO|nr:GNAT family N-acetyltransferase [Pseudoclavibacter chungangensis]KAB1654052.1 GNAT family N-acetyltransferase [Pseudoclavibacter chungangensis]NYJ66038.1 GNAT superfamily N-acetyltransferase [Pseudoclavibacter chungangensis]
MRLTNVAHLRLPFGRLLGYDVRVRPTGRFLPASFDQRRHVSAGDRPGSWMALLLRLPAPVDLDALAAAWLDVVARHGTLRTRFVRGDDGEPRLEEIEIGPGTWTEHDIAAGQAVNDALRETLDAHCRPYSSPSHRLCVVDTDAGPTVVVAADHSHVDMWSMLVIARDLLTALGARADGHDPQLAPARPFAEHTAALRERPTAPEDVRTRWAEVLAASGDVMPRFPLPLGDADPQSERVEVRDVLDVDDAAAFSAQAREDGVSTLTLAVSAMTAVTLELAGEPLRAVFPVHSRYDPGWHESVGWFITNAVLESTDPDPAACAAAVKEAVRLGSCPLEDVLRPWGGMPEAPGMFAISWLDLRRLPVRVDARGYEAQYVGATIRTDGVMLWFILDDDGLHLRCRYPDTHEARRNVGEWLDRLIARLRREARTSPGGRLRLDGREYRLRRAERRDVPAIVALLADDEIAAERERADLAHYESAYDAVSRDSTHFLAVVTDESERVVGTMQLSIIPGLSRGGATRLQIEGVRVLAAERSHGLGTAMLGWAHEHGRARGASLSQITMDRARQRALRFYRRLGYQDSHIGLKLPL